MHRLILLLLVALTSSYGFAESCCGRDGDADFTIEDEPTFLAFVSLSIPEASLKEMSKHLEKIGGQFVFRGLPNNSFEDFLKKVMDFREKGILAPIIVDPESFDEYNVEVVPTFVLTQEEGFEKVIGNVSIPYVLEIMKATPKE